MVRALLVGAIAALTLGCGEAERPGPAGDTAGETADGLQADPSQLSDEEVVLARANHDVCRPGYSRDCKIYFIDRAGIRNCPTLSEVCRPDGTGFYPCGESGPEPGLASEFPSGP